jgi:type II secretory pathway pseudopilin PulG
LLEVVLSVAIFVTVAAVGLMSLSACVRAVSRLKLEAQASDLAVTILSEVQMGVLDAVDFGPEPFDPPADEWTWQIAVVDQEIARDIAPMVQVEVIISNPSRGYVYRLAHLLPAAAPTLSALPRNRGPEPGGLT